MTKLSTMIAAALLVTLFWRTGGAQAPAPDDSYEARLTEAKGEVTVFSKEDPEGVPGEAGLPLDSGDRVATGDGSAEVSLDGLHIISLKPHSDFTLAETKKAKTQFALALGSLLAKVQKLAEGSHFSVRTPTAVCAVRGTEFGVEFAKDEAEDTHVGVFDEGKVDVTGAEGTPPERLILGQETRVSRGGAAATPYQLKRFVRHRAFMRNLRKRAQVVRKGWKALPPAERRARRQEMAGKLRKLKAQRLEGLKKKVERRKQGKQKDLRKDQKEMQKRKDAIRNRKR